MSELKTKKDKKTGKTREQRIAEYHEQVKLRNERTATIVSKIEQEIDQLEEEAKRRTYSEKRKKATKPMKPGKANPRAEAMRKIDEQAKPPVFVPFPSPVMKVVPAIALTDDGVVVNDKSIAQEIAEKTGIDKKSSANAAFARNYGQEGKPAIELSPSWLKKNRAAIDADMRAKGDTRRLNDTMRTLFVKQSHKWNTKAFMEDSK